MFGYIFLYNLMAMFYSYRAYDHMKNLITSQNPGWSMMGQGDEGYYRRYEDDEEAVFR